MTEQSLNARVTIVCVTYAKRWHLLRQALQSAKSEGAEQAVVIDNASIEAIGDLAYAEFGDWAKVKRLPGNTGSANGFKEGISIALAAGAEFIMLLDDDNVLEPGCLVELQKTYDDAKETPKDLLAVLAYRPQHQAHVTQGIPVERMWPDENSFFSFHVKDIFFKIWRRLPQVKTKYKSRAIGDKISMKFAPYSGLYFHRALPEKLGLPLAELVLYADDIEYTYRITCNGGAIWLATNAKVKDLEESWHVAKPFRNSFEMWLMGSSDFRVFYSARNLAYFESHMRRHHAFIRLINRKVYISFLRLYATRLKRHSRMQLLLLAIADGDSGHLGVNPQFPL